MTSRKSLYRKNLEDKTIGATKGSAPVVIYVARAKHDYKGQDEDELDLKIGDMIHCIDEEEDEPDWPEGFNPRLNTIGRFPKNFVEVVSEQSSNQPQQQRKTIRQSVVGKKPETITVNLSGDAVSVTPYVATVVCAYKHEQLDEHDLVMNEPLLVVGKSRLDEDWLYAKLRGQGEAKLIPGDYIKKSSMTTQQLMQMGPKPVKKSVRMSLTRKPTAASQKDNSASAKKIVGDLYFKVVEECTPEFEDELHLKIGDTVKAIEKTEDEGWYIGINQRDQKEGAFCEDFCRKIDAPKSKAAPAVPVAKPAVHQPECDLSEGDDGDIYEVFMPEPVEMAKPVSKNKRMSLMKPQASNVAVTNATKDEILPPNTKVQGLWEVVLAHEAEMEDEHTLKVGEIYEAIEDDGEDWWFGRIKGSSDELKAFCTDFMKKYEEPKVVKKISVRKSVQQAKAAAASASHKPEKPTVIPAAAVKPVPVEKPAVSPVKSLQNEIVIPQNVVSLEQLDTLKEDNSKLRAKIDEQAKEHQNLKETVRHMEENLTKLNNNFNSTNEKCTSLEKVLKEIQNSINKLEASNEGVNSEIRKLETSMNSLRNNSKPGMSDSERDDFEKMQARLEKFKNTILAQNKSIADISKMASTPSPAMPDTTNLSRRISVLEARFQRH